MGHLHKKGKELEDMISPTMLKERPKLVELWLPPANKLDTSLEQEIDEEEIVHECDCLKEHLD